MSFLGCRAYADEVDDRTLPWDPIWAYVLDEGDEQSLQRRNTIVKQETPDEHVVFSEPPELTRRPSFWHRREELVLQTKEPDEVDAGVSRIDDLHLEEAHKDHVVEERWTWELDREVFSFGSSNNNAAGSEEVRLDDDEEEDAEIQAADSARRWLPLRSFSDSHHGRPKNMGVLKQTFCGRKPTPVAVAPTSNTCRTHDTGSGADDEKRDLQEITKASTTWHFELDREEAFIDDDKNGNETEEVKVLGGWSLFGGKACPEKVSASASPFARRLK
jgi:hypothetical protein